MLNDKIAIVTGAASGIGYAVAQALRQEGAQVVMADVNEALLRESARKLGGVPFVGNLTKREDCRQLVDFTAQRFGRIDILANVAGVQHVCPIEEFPEDKWDFIISLMLTAPFLLTRYCWPYMKENGWGRIINMSSITSDYGIQRLATYSSTKGFVRLFSRSLHIELKSQGVNVTCVRPGAVATPLYNLNPTLQKIGLTLGFIITPHRLAKKGIRAMFAGKSTISPGLFTKILGLVAYIPISVLKPLRRWV